MKNENKGIINKKVRYVIGKNVKFELYMPLKTNKNEYYIKNVSTN